MGIASLSPTYALRILPVLNEEITKNTKDTKNTEDFLEFAAVRDEQTLGFAALTPTYGGC